MSTPDNDAKHLDPILKYAPRHARDKMPRMPRVTPIEWPLPSSRGENSRAVSGDRDVLVKREHVLDAGIPEPPPPFAGGRDIWRITLRTAGAMVVAAFVAWIVVSIPRAGLQHQPRVQESSADPPISTKVAAAVPLLTTPLPQPPRPEGPANIAEATSKRDRLDSTEPALPLVEVPLINQTPADVGHEQPHSTQPTAADLITRQLNRDEVASLLKRGDDFLKAGDLASARLVFRRATEAGDAAAALALAGTFDSSVLEKLGFAGFWADVAMARMWYQRAAQFGSTEAPQRLQQLATKINP